MNKTYIIDGLGCANCAAKMERKIQELPEVENASIVFATSQLRVTADDPDALLPQMQEICQSIEDHVEVLPLDTPTENNVMQKSHARELLGIIIGALLFAAGIIINQTGILAETVSNVHTTLLTPALLIPLALFGLAYLILGGKVLLTAGKNITRGQIFDENFLMAIATIAAFCIGEFAEGAGVMLFYRIGEFFEHVAVEKSRTQIMEAVDMRPETVLLVNSSDEHCDCDCEHHHHIGHDSEITEIPAEQARPGDIILVRPGDRIPLDGIITEGESRIDASPVTGEPVPVRVTAGTEVISGCINENSVLKIEVTKPLAESMVTRILDSVENAAAGKPKIDKFITRFARIYTPIVVTLAILTAIVPSLITGDWNEWITTAITFLVISCPCALVISVPLAFFAGIGAASKLGILFKGGTSIEALQKIKTVIMDKTGTITRGNFVVQSITTVNGVSEQDVLQIAAACEAHSTHPIAVSIMQKAHEAGISNTMQKAHYLNADTDSAVSDIDSAAESHVGSIGYHPTSHSNAGAIEIEEIPGKGIRAQLPAGAALCGNAALLAQYGITVPPAKETTCNCGGASNSCEAPAISENSGDCTCDGGCCNTAPAADHNYEAPAASPERTAPTTGGTIVHIALAGKYLGSIHISDTLKPGAAKAIAALKLAGLIPAMLTGDNKTSAHEIARITGISETHAELLPEDKLETLKDLRQKHGPAMFVGDGINDAPVLAGADIGAAMGTGADAAIEAADVVFMNSTLEAIPQSIAIAKATGKIAIQNIVFALAIKLLVILLGLAGFANIWAAVFADTGVAMLCILNSLRILWKDFAK